MLELWLEGFIVLEEFLRDLSCEFILFEIFIIIEFVNVFVFELVVCDEYESDVNEDDNGDNDDERMGVFVVLDVIL